MKNILLLTPIYPSIDQKEGTPICHYFAKEWIKLNYNVIVIHYPVNFPNFIYKLAKPFNSQLSALVGSVIRIHKLESTTYTYEGVKVKRIPLTKFRPHTRYPKKEILKALEQTTQYLKECDFTPDVILSHWVNPQLEIMFELKKIYKVPTCYVAHDTGRDLHTIYKQQANEFIANIDLFGFRSNYIKTEFTRSFLNDNKPKFLCYSGIPESFFETPTTERDFSSCKKMIFVGTLIKRKYPSILVDAAYNTFKHNSFELSFVGEGHERKVIERKSEKLKIQDRVKLVGFVNRNKLISLLDSHDIFIMISRNEAYGLVYLEAMSRGCITIAAKNEGFDGIIKNGYNGFLCTAGDTNELTSLLKNIQKLSKEELKTISYNAMETAKELTDKKAAKKYIVEVTKQYDILKNNSR